jgi:hypothetical protein
MARKPAPDPDDPEQSERFIAMAREVEATEDEEEAERAFREVTSAKHPAVSLPKSRLRRSGKT